MGVSATPPMVKYIEKDITQPIPEPSWNVETANLVQYCATGSSEWLFPSNATPMFRGREVDPAEKLRPWVLARYGGRALKVHGIPRIGCYETAVAISYYDPLQEKYGLRIFPDKVVGKQTPSGMSLTTKGYAFFGKDSVTFLDYAGNVQQIDLKHDASRRLLTATQIRDIASGSNQGDLSENTEIIGALSGDGVLISRTRMSKRRWFYCQGPAVRKQIPVEVSENVYPEAWITDEHALWAVTKPTAGRGNNGTAPQPVLVRWTPTSVQRKPLPLSGDTLLVVMRRSGTRGTAVITYDGKTDKTSVICASDDGKSIRLSKVVYADGTSWARQAIAVAGSHLWMSTRKHGIITLTLPAVDDGVM